MGVRLRVVEKNEGLASHSAILSIFAVFLDLLDFAGNLGGDL